ncbi:MULTISPECIES: HPr family phosphocarrier protein [unclassified Cryobacterium]|uniref:HPr family phosphocarrier protein n=1 Tax=unclassified Cryobacterium TaxID=2649013 RepID=UPI00106C13E3|nr:MULTISPECIES: HPr family phosphocarrier protein [unclassified Cryobacterium]TFB98422.1 HPr family phosphocarrier protein [Cryobacterium sp. MDB2-A-1]TFC08304.1 HPr family phosphocarrier protein [Cryobacterium sp. MDB2-33-2]TFC08571.1 HPr family phosphocarrier protein [Cryobacterium sp. MDB2-A-2]TFC15105.1 HPr family phosphocarrier protein [Cryobacterium sp. MDB2-10]TFC35899.1 HPr family phosphocarrier protein [Cryobacterium sp. MDB1-18-2]
MIERTVRIGSANGLHARPAKLFTKAAADSGVKVTIEKAGGKAVNAASILAVISLGLGNGDEVTIATVDDGASATLDTLVSLLAADHDLPAADAATSETRVAV